MNIESRAADLRTSIKLMTGDLCLHKYGSFSGGTAGGGL